MQTVLVIAIVLAAAVYMARRLRRPRAGGCGCAGGCDMMGAENPPCACRPGQDPSTHSCGQVSCGQKQRTFQ